MCIRDSGDAALYTGIMQSISSFCNAGFIFFDNDLPYAMVGDVLFNMNTMAVSYTHLDVYKRQVQFRIVISTVFAALHSVLAMCLARIYSLKHSTHLMRKVLINEIRYMVVKALS